MKNLLRTTALTCVAVALAFSLATSPALAKNDNGDLVRTAQVRLTALGYYAGSDDGILGQMTESALMDFQRGHGLTPTGQLTPETYALLTYNKEMPVGMAMYHVGHENPLIIDNQDTIISSAPVSWDDRWHYVRDQSLPMRFAHLNVREDDSGTVRHYAVTLNGHAVLFANDQPGVLRVSQTYMLGSDDVVIFTAYQASGECPNKSYLLSVHSDGSYTNPREVGNCAGSYEAHVANNMLFLNFPGYNVASNWESWDEWRYYDNRVIRL
jgi:hypothetical protein